MSLVSPEKSKVLRPTALVLSAFLTCPLFAGCGHRQSGAVAPPIDDTRGGSQTYSAPGNTQAHQGLSTGQKVALLAGAAGLYYLYRQHQNKAGEGPQGQYYLSKNGRVYYRDAQHRAHWVTAPSQGIKVPESEAQDYRGFQGYNNSPSGRSLAGLGNAPAPAGY